MVSAIGPKSGKNRLKIVKSRHTLLLSLLKNSSNLLFFLIV